MNLTITVEVASTIEEIAAKYRFERASPRDRRFEIHLADVLDLCGLGACLEALECLEQGGGDLATQVLVDYYKQNESVSWLRNRLGLNKAANSHRRAENVAHEPLNFLLVYPRMAGSPEAIVLQALWAYKPAAGVDGGGGRGPGLECGELLFPPDKVTFDKLALEKPLASALWGADGRG